MQYRPDATELLSDVAALLEDRVLAAVTGPLQHQVRVAANLLRIVERELRSAAEAEASERARLVALAGDHGSLVEARSRLVERLLAPDAVDADELARIHASIVATLRDDLAISKPGYSDWTGV